jgi:hypothetical protein
MLQGKFQQELIGRSVKLAQHSPPSSAEFQDLMLNYILPFLPMLLFATNLSTFPV